MTGPLTGWTGNFQEEREYPQTPSFPTVCSLSSTYNYFILDGKDGEKKQFNSGSQSFIISRELSKTFLIFSKLKVEASTAH